VANTAAGPDMPSDARRRMSARNGSTASCMSSQAASVSCT
jgi:hypothetical protein